MNQKKKVYDNPLKKYTGTGQKGQNLKETTTGPGKYNPLVERGRHITQKKTELRRRSPRGERFSKKKTWNP